MESALPAPLVAADVDLNGMTFMPLDLQRLLDSELWLTGTGDECKAAVSLWCKAWQQKPAASLPDNDRLLAAYSGAGARWPKVKAMAMHGFVKCSDGRFYHPVVAEKATEAWSQRAAYRDRLAAARAAKEAKRGTKTVSITDSIIEPKTETVAGPVTDLTIALKVTERNGTDSPPSPPLVNGHGRHVDKPDDVLFAFYEIRRMIWETPPPGSYLPKDLSIAKGWLEKSHGDSEPLRALFEREMRRMGDRGAPPPGTPWFFHNSVDDAAASGWAGYA